MYNLRRNTSILLTKIKFLDFLGGSAVKNPPTMQETWVQLLVQEDLLEKGMASHSSIFAWRISWTEVPGGLQSMGSWRVGHHWSNWASMQWIFGFLKDVVLALKIASGACFMSLMSHHLLCGGCSSVATLVVNKFLLEISFLDNQCKVVESKYYFWPKLSVWPCTSW